MKSTTTVKNLLTVKKAGGQGAGLLVTAKIPGTGIALIGSSCLATLNHDSASLTLVPIQVRETIALKITPPSNGAPERPLRVALQAGRQDTWSDPFLNLDHPLFATSNGDQIHLSEDGLLVITAAGEKFISPDSGLSPSDAAKLRPSCAEEKAWVASGGTLCQYLAGRMTIDQLKAAAEALAVAESLPAKYAALEQQFNTLSAVHARALRDLDTATRSLRERTSERNALTETLQKLKAAINAAVCWPGGWRCFVPGLADKMRLKQIWRLINP